MKRRLRRMWLLSSVLGTLASPVVVLQYGPKQSLVRLQHRRRWNRKWQERGTAVRVPSYALTSTRCFDYVSVGRGTFVPANSPRGRAMIARWK